MNTVHNVLLKVEQVKWAAYGVTQIMVTTDWVRRRRQRGGDPEINSKEAIICLVIEEMKNITRSRKEIMIKNKYDF
ncbi:MAG: hypothetical protein GY820_28065 [Gammaproteobacteria bacterium]|nr:hypothetical protein [Gammaproteobacteria bacterium]